MSTELKEVKKMETQTRTFLFGTAKGKTQIIARIAIMMALTVAVQYLTGLAGIQLLTGSFVNLFLLLSVLLCGLIGGISVGCVTPFIALALGLNPNILLVPFIALSNALYVAAFAFVCKLAKLSTADAVWKKIVILSAGFAIGAVIKFLFMYLICLKLLFPLFLAEAMVTKLAAAWGILQLATASIGGAVATALYFPLCKVKLICYADAENAEETEEPKEN